MSLRARLTVDLGAIVANWRALDALTPPGCETAAVVKGNGYGCGAAQVGRALARAGVRTFFVAVAFEGERLRDAVGPAPAIYVLAGYSRETTARYAAHDLRPVLNSASQARAWFEARPGAPAAVQVDTGMNRLGMEADEFAGLGPLPDAVRLVMSHMGCADDAAHPMNGAQLAEFLRLTDGAGQPRSLSATAGMLLGPDYQFDMARPGIGLFGGLPFAQARPVVALEAPIIQIRDLAPGESVGYAAAWTAARPSRIATVGLGYADGLIRASRRPRRRLDRRYPSALRRARLDGPRHPRRHRLPLRARRHGRVHRPAPGHRRGGRDGRHDRPRGADRARRPLPPNLYRRLSALPRLPRRPPSAICRAMRRLVLASLAALAACAAPPDQIDWQAWLSAERSIGRMRDDPAPADAPFDNATLARNFRTIAFEVERDPFGTGAAPQAVGGSQLLRRWQGPVLWAVYASPAEQARLRPLVHGFSHRLAELTGLAIRPAGREAGTGPQPRAGPGSGPRAGPVAQPANLQIWVVPDRIGGFIDSLPGEAPDTGEPAGRVRARIAEFIRTWYGATASPCAAQFFNVDRPAPEAGTILGALVLIRAGLPEPLLRSCIEEELTQAMGLPNDDAGVRPSIFNDEKEFGVLTAHDELLLRVLYDPRLAPGMPPEAAMPVVRQIIAELRPAE